MSASATAIIHWNAIPVFADIESETFCLDPAAVEANITQHTKAIMAIDIFGQSADMDSLKDLADRHNLKIISDSAQAPGAKYKGKHAGTLAHVGGFSLNYHKHIHTGEGGIVVTNDENIAERLKLIRNHAEAVVGKMGIQDFSNMVGYNFRLGEIECAIGIEQLKKLDGLISGRVKAADRLTAGLSNLKGLSAPTIRKDCTHVYYVYPMLIDEDSLGVSAPRIAEALRAEGVLGLSTSYQNLHLLPMYQRKIAFGSRGFPWNSDIARRKVSYEKGICPVAERLNGNGFLGLGMCKFELNDDDVDLIIAAFQKVWGKLSAL
jgi:perosamine synthetase